MKNLILILIIVLWGTIFKTASALGQEKPNCSKNPILCQILRNNPTINRSYARDLSNHIHRISKHYNLPADLFTAILMQESSYKVSAKNCLVGLRDPAGSTDSEIKVCADYGIAQINFKTAKQHNFDLHKLTEDLEYSVDAGAKILSWFSKTYKNKEPKRWFCRYNTGTASAASIRKNCTKYIELVNRWR